MPDFSIVYVLVNPAMPGLVKIGRTSQEDVGTRLAQLYTTGVPVPFELKYACRVPNPEEVESALHLAFGPQRINPRREFFRIEPEQAIAFLNCYTWKTPRPSWQPRQQVLTNNPWLPQKGCGSAVRTWIFMKWEYPMAQYLNAYRQLRLSLSLARGK
jgi:hypothetical protein